jgi:hypothetical protein
MDDRPTQSPSHALPAIHQDMHDTPPQADVDEILRRKRKAREYKVRCCFPCPNMSKCLAGPTD